MEHHTLKRGKHNKILKLGVYELKHIKQDETAVILPHLKAFLKQLCGTELLSAPCWYICSWTANLCEAQRWQVCSQPATLWTGVGGTLPNIPPQWSECWEPWPGGWGQGSCWGKLPAAAAPRSPEPALTAEKSNKKRLMMHIKHVWKTRENSIFCTNVVWTMSAEWFTAEAESELSNLK